MRKALPVLLLVLVLAVPVQADELIDYRDRSLKSGDSIELQQGYSIELGWIKKDLDAAGVMVHDDSFRPLDELIMEEGEERTVERGDDVVLRISLRYIRESDRGVYVAGIEVEQYRDPIRPYPSPLLQEEGFRVGSGEPRELEDGYSLKSSRSGDAVKVSLVKSSIPLGRYEVAEGDVIVYSRVVKGTEYTILTGKVSSIFEDTQGNVNVVFSSLNQYQTPEADRYVDGPAAIFTAAMTTAGVLIILLSFMFRRKR
ncbi:MAG: hypothetical protein MAG715_00583 [Methanonatronarchaeales archaeon]|nr:hypothetical protein [Methanonatronarchaeales archaeon]